MYYCHFKHLDENPSQWAAALAHGRGPHDFKAMPQAFNQVFLIAIHL